MQGGATASVRPAHVHPLGRQLVDGGPRGALVCGAYSGGYLPPPRSYSFASAFGSRPARSTSFRASDFLSHASLPSGSLMVHRWAEPGNGWGGADRAPRNGRGLRWVHAEVPRLGNVALRFARPSLAPTYGLWPCCRQSTVAGNAILIFASTNCNPEQYPGDTSQTPCPTSPAPETPAPNSPVRAGGSSACGPPLRRRGRRRSSAGGAPARPFVFAPTDSTLRWRSAHAAERPMRTPNALSATMRYNVHFFVIVYALPYTDGVAPGFLRQALRTCTLHRARCPTCASSKLRPVCRFFSLQHIHFCLCSRHRILIVLQHLRASLLRLFALVTRPLRQNAPHSARHTRNPKTNDAFHPENGVIHTKSAAFGTRSDEIHAENDFGFQY